MGYAPEGRVQFEMKFESAVKVGGVEVGMEDITSMVIQGSLTKAMGGKRDVNREDGSRVYQGMRCRFHWSRRRSRHVIDIWRSPTISSR